MFYVAYTVYKGCLAAYTNPYKSPKAAINAYKKGCTGPCLIYSAPDQQIQITEFNKVPKDFRKALGKQITKFL
jgi:hypothetical protein